LVAFGDRIGTFQRVAYHLAVDAERSINTPTNVEPLEDFFSQIAQKELPHRSWHFIKL
jgi:hypothetical protein